MSEITVNAPTTVLTASQVRSLLAEVERKEKENRVLTVKDVKPGQFFQYTKGCLAADGFSRLMLFRRQEWAPGQYYVRDNMGSVERVIPMEAASALYNAPVILVRNFDGDAL